jgi:hypothetical protein
MTSCYPQVSTAAAEQKRTFRDAPPEPEPPTLTVGGARNGDGSKTFFWVKVKSTGLP